MGYIEFAFEEPSGLTEISVFVSGNPEPLVASSAWGAVEVSPGVYRTTEEWASLNFPYDAVFDGDSAASVTITTSDTGYDSYGDYYAESPIGRYFGDTFIVSGGSATLLIQPPSLAAVLIASLDPTAEGEYEFKGPSGSLIDPISIHHPDDIVTRMSTGRYSFVSAWGEGQVFVELEFLLSDIYAGEELDEYELRIEASVDMSGQLYWTIISEDSPWGDTYYEDLIGTSFTLRVTPPRPPDFEVTLAGLLQDTHVHDFAVLNGKYFLAGDTGETVVVWESEDGLSWQVGFSISRQHLVYPSFSTAAGKLFLTAEGTTHRYTEGVGWASSVHSDPDENVLRGVDTDFLYCSLTDDFQYEINEILYSTDGENYSPTSLSTELRPYQMAAIQSEEGTVILAPAYWSLDGINFNPVVSGVEVDLEYLPDVVTKKDPNTGKVYFQHRAWEGGDARLFEWDDSIKGWVYPNEDEDLSYGFNITGFSRWGVHIEDGGSWEYAFIEPYDPEYVPPVPTYQIDSNEENKGPGFVFDTGDYVIAVYVGYLWGGSVNNPAELFLITRRHIPDPDAQVFWTRLRGTHEIP